MSTKLVGKRIAILATHGFEQSELEKPKQALEQAGAFTFVISPEETEIMGWNETNWGHMVKVDLKLSDADANDFDGLLLPGGVLNPDTLRMLPEAVQFVRAFFDTAKPIAAICHGPQLLIEADVVKNRTVTSFPSLKTDLTNAGAYWVDHAVVTDQGIVTSRRPSDIPRFNEKMIEEFSKANLKNRMAADKAA